MSLYFQHTVVTSDLTHAVPRLHTDRSDRHQPCTAQELRRTVTALAHSGAAVHLSPAESTHGTLGSRAV